MVAVKSKFWVGPTKGYVDVDRGLIEVIALVDRNVAMKVYTSYALETYDDGFEENEKYKRYVVYRYVSGYGLHQDDGEVNIIPLEVLEEVTAGAFEERARWLEE